MRLFVMVAITALALDGVARAQSATVRESKGYVEGVAQSAFGNVTSQSFGAEAGVTVRRGVQVYIEAGDIRDTAPSALGANAQTIANFLVQSLGDLTFRVREPVVFGTAGLKYIIPAAGSVEPYVLGGAGIARVTKDVTFGTAGRDITANLSQYGVVLGSDLAGAETKPMFSVGGGVMWAAWGRLVADLQYRFGRVLTSGQGLDQHRAGIGIGVRF